MNRCKNCKYYKSETYRGLDKNGIYRPSGDGQNEYLKMFVGSCSNEHFKYEGIHHYNSDAESQKHNVLYSDYDDYAAYLYVGEEFGCIYFEVESK